MYLFYTPDIQHFNTLSEEESAHCVRVLRHQVGDEILLTDGRGITYTARLTLAHPKHCEFEVIAQEKQAKSHDFHLHIALAPTKNIERTEWAIEKMTEIGVDEISLLNCRFSERKEVRTDRLEKIVLSAAKQSLTPYLPVLHPMRPFAQFLQETEADELYIAHCYKDKKQELKDLLNNEKLRQGSVVVLIGPEGDFSEQEIQAALAKGYEPVGLGKSRLRTETAAVVACHTAILMKA